MENSFSGVVDLTMGNVRLSKVSTSVYTFICTGMGSAYREYAPWAVDKDLALQKKLGVIVTKKKFLAAQSGVDIEKGGSWTNWGIRLNDNVNEIVMKTSIVNTTPRGVKSAIMFSVMRRDGAVSEVRGKQFDMVHVDGIPKVGVIDRRFALGSIEPITTNECEVLYGVSIPQSRLNSLTRDWRKLLKHVVLKVEKQPMPIAEKVSLSPHNVDMTVTDRVAPSRNLYR